MKRILLALLVCSEMLSAQAAELTWFKDWPAAQAQAKAEKKPVLVAFTGSDWCPDCAVFEREVTATKAFGEFAKKRLVLMRADFPEKKPQPEAEKQANKELKAKYDMHGFPSVILLDAEGNVLGRPATYRGGGAAAYVTKLEKLLTK